jgi:hypothetical protein
LNVPFVTVLTPVAPLSGEAGATNENVPEAPVLVRVLTTIDPELPLSRRSTGRVSHVCPPARTPALAGPRKFTGYVPTAGGISSDRACGATSLPEIVKSDGSTRAMIDMAFQSAPLIVALSVPLRVAGGVCVGAEGGGVDVGADGVLPPHAPVNSRTKSEQRAYLIRGMLAR